MKEQENKITAFDEVIIRTRKARAIAAGVKNVDELYEKASVKKMAELETPSTQDGMDDGMGM